jgi:hypothetical protein
VVVVIQGILEQILVILVVLVGAVDHLVVVVLVEQAILLQ